MVAASGCASIGIARENRRARDERRNSGAFDSCTRYAALGSGRPEKREEGR
jgi:hypothetical protein